MNAYDLIQDLASQIEPPADGTLSRTIHNDAQCKAVLFGFSAGQELSEHTASMSAILQLLQGKADVTLGPDHIEAQTGTWIHMPAGLPHSIKARTPLSMLLLLLKQPTAM